MAEINANLKVKTSTDYDKINLTSKSDLINFNNTGTNLTSTDAQGAITEVNTKVNTNITNIGTLTSLTTADKSNLVNATNEVNGKATSALQPSNVVDSLATAIAVTQDGVPVGCKSIKELNTNVVNNFDYFNKLFSNGELISDTRSIDVNNPLARMNTKTWCVYSPTTVGMPPGCTLGFRTYEHFNLNWNIIKILEVYPVQGRVWTRRYDTAGGGTWYPWESTQIGSYIQVLDLSSVGGGTSYTCSDFSDAKELTFRVSLGGGYYTWLTLPNTVGADGNASLYEGAGQHYRLGLQIINTSNTIKVTSYTRGTSWVSSNFGLTVYKRV